MSYRCIENSSKYWCDSCLRNLWKKKNGRNIAYIQSVPFHSSNRKKRENYLLRVIQEQRMTAARIRTKFSPAMSPP